MKTVTASSLLAALVIASAPAFSQGHGHAHVHGIASLQITVEGATLTLRLHTPLENLVGFEHTPKTEQQKKAIKDMEESLRVPASHFTPTAAAGCAPAATKLDSPFSVTGKPEMKTGAGSNTTPGGARGHDKEADAHAELNAQYVFRCRNPDRLQDVEVKLFDRFHRLRRVDVELAGPRGQKSYRLTAKSRVAKW